MKMTSNFIPTSLYAWIVAALVIVCSGITVNAQQSVFSALTNRKQVADEYYKYKNYQSALSIYLEEAGHDKEQTEVFLKIARCYFYLHEYAKACGWFERISEKSGFANSDYFLYAESLCALQRYDEAIIWFKKILDKNPDDAIISQKIWRLKNLKYLFEDTVHYTVKPLPINSEYGDICPVLLENHLVFMSNRKTTRLFARVDAASNKPFFRLYQSKIVSDTFTSKPITYESPALFCKELRAVYHEGPVAFYEGGTKMVYVASKPSKDKKASKTLQLYFAEKQNDKWEVTGAFPYNSDNYSITSPTINSKGSVLFFASDMPGSVGGRDLYKSELKNGQWTKPVNLGGIVNTNKDESHPFLHNDVSLYFASNGHAGIGGLDIYKVDLLKDGYGEVQNLGYPINTSKDEFGIVLNSKSTFGYFSSNRNHTYNNDDLFELEIDLQTYPLVLNGVLRYKEAEWKDATQLKVLANALLLVIDNVRDIIVQQTSSDAQGNFVITIPHFSRYKIKVVEQDGNESIVSLDISKQRKSEGKHEIVVVHDSFKIIDKTSELKRQ